MVLPDWFVYFLDALTVLILFLSAFLGWRRKDLSTVSEVLKGILIVVIAFLAANAVVNWKIFWPKELTPFYDQVYGSLLRFLLSWIIVFVILVYLLSLILGPVFRKLGSLKKEKNDSSKVIPVIGLFSGLIAAILILNLVGITLVSIGMKDTEPVGNAKEIYDRSFVRYVCEYTGEPVFHALGEHYDLDVLWELYDNGIHMDEHDVQRIRHWMIEHGMDEA